MRRCNGMPRRLWKTSGRVFTTSLLRREKRTELCTFSRSITREERESILDRAMKQSDRYRAMKASGASDEQIRKAFITPVEMQVFSYQGSIDTIMSPLDSIRYQKSFLRVGFMSMDPNTGHVKAYVGGPDFTHFQYDMASVGRRQIGSTGNRSYIR